MFFRYWYPGIQSWVRKKVENCMGCKHKTSSFAKFAPPLRPYSPESAPWMRVHVDLTEGFYDVTLEFRKKSLIRCLRKMATIVM